MRRSDSRPPLPPHFVAFAWRYHACACRFAPSGPAPDRGPGVCGRAVPRPDLIAWRRSGLPGSWGTLVCLRPVLRPRQDRRTRPLRCVGTAPAQCHDEGSHESVISGLNHTASALAVYASQGGLPHHHARLASGCWPSSTGRDWLPAGFLRKVSEMYPTSLPPFPSFLAQPFWQPAVAVKWQWTLPAKCAWQCDFLGKVTFSRNPGKIIGLHLPHRTRLSQHGCRARILPLAWLQLPAQS